jgi:hypothetical protein
MAKIDDYANDLNKALIDAANDPIFQSVMQQSDYSLINVTLSNGAQGQVRALKKSSVKDVLKRVFVKVKSAGDDLKNWICSPDEFDLCNKLDAGVTGVLMRDLDNFLKNKKVKAGMQIAKIATLPLGFSYAGFLTIVSAVGFVNNAILELCDCPPETGTIRPQSQRKLSGEEPKLT